MGCCNSKEDEPEVHTPQKKSYHLREEAPSTSYNKSHPPSKASGKKLQAKSSVPRRKTQIPKIVLTPPSTENLAFTDDQTTQ